MSIEKGSGSEQINEDLKSKEGVIDLICSSKNYADLCAKCDRIKKANGGVYPDFWFEVVNQSGLLSRVEDSFDKKK